MKVLDIFSWLPAKEMSLEQIEKIFEEYFKGTYKGEYIISLETPCNIGKDILNCRAELMEEGKKTGQILKDDNIIALIGYREQSKFEVGGIDFYDYQICRREKFYRIATVL